MTIRTSGTTSAIRARRSRTATAYKSQRLRKPVNRTEHTPTERPSQRRSGRPERENRLSRHPQRDLRPPIRKPKDKKTPLRTRASVKSTEASKPKRDYRNRDLKRNKDNRNRDIRKREYELKKKAKERARFFGF